LIVDLALFSFSSFVVAHFFPGCPKGVLGLFVFLSPGLAHCDRILALIEELFGVLALFRARP
jgi:hypothetical protein